MRELQRMLHAAREAIGQKQIDVASATGMSKRTIWRVEQAVGTTTVDTVVRLRNYYETQGITVVRMTDPLDSWELVFSENIAPVVAPLGGIFLITPTPLLRAARALLGLTQNELSEKVALAHTTLRRLENGSSDVEPDTVLKYVSKLRELGIAFGEPTAVGKWHMSLDKSGSGATG